MKVWPLQIGIQQAPEDGYDPAGPQKFRVIAYEGDPGKLPCDECAIVPLTGTYTSSEEALAALHRSVRESFTRYEADLLQRDLDGLRHDTSALARRTDDLAHAAGRRFNPEWSPVGYRRSGA